MNDRVCVQIFQVLCARKKRWKRNAQGAGFADFISFLYDWIIHLSSTIRAMERYGGKRFWIKNDEKFPILNEFDYLNYFRCRMITVSSRWTRKKKMYPSIGYYDDNFGGIGVDGTFYLSKSKRFSSQYYLRPIFLTPMLNLTGYVRNFLSSGGNCVRVLYS